MSHRKRRYYHFICTRLGEHEPYIFPDPASIGRQRDLRPGRLKNWDRLSMGDPTQELRQDQQLWKFNCGMCSSDYRFRLSTLLEAMWAKSLIDGKPAGLRPDGTHSRGYYMLHYKQRIADAYEDFDLSYAARLLSWVRSLSE